MAIVVETIRAFLLLFVAPVLGGIAAFLIALQRFLYIVARFVYGWNRPVLLKDCVVVLTGAAGGFGQEISRRVVEQGGIVYALDVVDPADAAEKLPAVNCHYFQIDITDNKQLEKFVNGLRKKNIQVYALINNAGIAGKMTAATQSTPDITEKVMGVNFFSAVELTRLLFDLKNPLFKFNSKKCIAGQAPTRSRIINVTSVAGLVSGGGMSNYCASKFALEAYSDSTRIECGDQYLDVALIEPYFAATGIYRDILDDNAEKILEGSILKDNFLASREKFKKALGKNTLMTSAFVVNYIMSALTDAVPQDRYVVAPPKPELALRLVMHLPNYFGLVDKMKKNSTKKQRI